MQGVDQGQQAEDGRSDRSQREPGNATGNEGILFRRQLNKL